MSDKPRCRPLPPSVLEGRAAPEPSAEDELERLYEALGDLPAAERTAVIASYAYDEGVVGAAIEADVETAEADRLGQRGLDLLRNALQPPDKPLRPPARPLFHDRGDNHAGYPAWLSPRS